MGGSGVGGWGGGKGKRGWGGGKGGGKSLIGRTKKEKLAWVGGLPAGSASKDLNKALQEHISSASGVSSKYAEIGKNGHGAAVFKTAEDQATALAAVNGTNFQGSILQLDE